MYVQLDRDFSFCLATVISLFASSHGQSSHQGFLLFYLPLAQYIRMTRRNFFYSLSCFSAVRDHKQEHHILDYNFASLAPRNGATKGLSSHVTILIVTHGRYLLFLSWEPTICSTEWVFPNSCSVALVLSIWWNFIAVMDPIKGHGDNLAAIVEFILPP